MGGGGTQAGNDSKNCHSRAEKRTHYPRLKRVALVAGEKANRSQDRVLGIQMLRGYGAGVVRGTHSVIYSFTIPSLVISSTLTDSKRY